jgi:CubicO group peptidase (beta-lactamase class C family)
MNKAFAIVSGFLLILTLFLNQSSAQTKIADSKYKKSINQAETLIADLMSNQGIPGLSAAAAVNDKIVWSEGFGSADLEGAVSVSRQTRFRIGSVSKLFTASAIAKLYEQGLIDLDAPVQNYVPAFPKKEYEITSRELVGHLAGIRHYNRSEFVNQQSYNSVSDTLKIFQTDALLHQPGSKYFYSSYGYVLLSNVVEGAAKQNFAAYLQNQLFNPLQMNGTTADDNRKIIKQRARFYARSSDGQISNEIYADYSDRLAAGGFISTAEDLVSFGSKSLQGSLFKPETRSLIFTPQKTLDGKETTVGFGWRIGKDGKGRAIYYHGGDAVGGRAILVVYPEAKVVVAILCNLTFAKISEADAANFADLFIQQNQ